jgi:Fe-S oxidoreductase
MDFRDIKSYAENCIRDCPPPCACACPFGLDVRNFIDRVASGKSGGALRMYREAVLFPGTVSRLCPAYCGDFCVRAEYDGKVDLKRIERGILESVGYVAPVRYAVPPKAARVAVIGAGLSGLACTYRLAGKGYRVTLFEASGKIGGAALKAVPDAVADADFRNAFKYIRCELRPSEKINDLDAIRRDFDIVYVATGKGGDDFGLLDSWDGRTLASSVGGVYAGGSLTDCPPMWDIENGLRAASAAEEFLKTGRNDGVGPLFNRPPVNEKFYALKYDFGAPAGSESSADDGAGGASASANDSFVCEAKRCPACNCTLCMDVCPLMEYHKTNPKRIAADLGVTVLPVDGKIRRVASRMLNSCNLCGLCDAVCPAGVKTSAAMFESRRLMSDSGNIPAAFHDFWIDDMRFSFSDEAYAAISAGPGGGDLLFFPGCQLAASSPGAVEKTYEYIKSVRPNASLLLSCCGVPAAWAAEDGILAAGIDKLRADWSSLGRPEVLFACSTCMQSFARYLPEVKGRLVYEWLASNDGGLRYGDAARAIRGAESRGGADGDFGAGAARTAAAATAAAPLVCVFDPCSGREDGAGRAAVRRLAAKSGFSLAELDLNGPKAACCGFGGHIYSANPSLFREIVHKRTAERACTYIAYCANCRDLFLHEGRDSRHILDILFPSGDAVLPSLSERRQNRAALKSRFTEGYFKPRVPAVTLDISDGILDKMNRLLLLNEDAEAVVVLSEGGGAKAISIDDGYFIGCAKRLSATVWVEYEMRSETRAVLRNIYSHRMNIKGKARDGRSAAGAADESRLICAKCRLPLQNTETKFEYLKHEFSHAVPCCPSCDTVYVSEELATGKMLEVETMLEDK